MHCGRELHTSTRPTANLLPPTSPRQIGTDILKWCPLVEVILALRKMEDNPTSGEPQKDFQILTRSALSNLPATKYKPIVLNRTLYSRPLIPDTFLVHFLWRDSTSAYPQGNPHSTQLSSNNNWPDVGHEQSKHKLLRATNSRSEKVPHHSSSFSHHRAHLLMKLQLGVNHNTQVPVMVHSTELSTSQIISKHIMRNFPRITKPHCDTF